ncbi:MAG: folate-binding protein [Gammaproteobacteria bacterium]
MKVDWKNFLVDAGAEMDGDTVSDFGNPEREARAALGGTVFANLGFMGVIAVHGDDAGSFLQSQLSNDIRSVAENASQLSAFCTPKGRILGLLRIFHTGDTYYLRLPLDALDGVLDRLRMYVLRADVTLEDATENFLRIGISGEQAPAYLSAAGLAVPETLDAVITAGNSTVIRVPGNTPRFELYLTSLESAKSIWNAVDVHAAPVGEPVWRLLEIQAGIPNVFAATAELFVPQMINLQLINGVNFQKGCYPGQEIVARMQYLGTLKRRMYLGHIDRDEPAVPGDTLFAAADTQQAAGRIVDAQAHPNGGQLALAVLQISAAESGGLHLDSATGAAFKLLTLPYPFESPAESD